MSYLDFIRDTRKTYSGLAKGRAPGMRTPARVAGIAAAALTARIAAREQARHPGEQLLALVAFAAVQCRQRAVQVLLGKPVRQLFEHRVRGFAARQQRSEEHTSELQSLMRNSYAV